MFIVSLGVLLVVGFVVFWQIRARCSRDGPDRRSADLGAQYVNGIKNSLSSFCPTISGERIKVAFTCRRSLRRTGWRPSYQPSVVVTVTIAAWTVGDESREKIVQEEVFRELVPKTKIPVQLIFRREQKEKK